MSAPTKLTPEMISDILKELASGVAKQEVRRKYHICWQTIYDIINGKQKHPKQAPERDIWVVSDSTCKGCAYYAQDGSPKTCDIYIQTRGDIRRTMPPCECIYKTDKPIKHKAPISKLCIQGRLVVNLHDE